MLLPIFRKTGCRKPCCCEMFQRQLRNVAFNLVFIVGPSSIEKKIMPRKDCLKPRNTGYCRLYNVRWYFDGKDALCKPFVYGGCGGNNNNFQTQEACSSACNHAGKEHCEKLNRVPYMVLKRFIGLTKKLQGQSQLLVRAVITWPMFYLAA